MPPEREQPEQGLCEITVGWIASPRPAPVHVLLLDVAHILLPLWPRHRRRRVQCSSSVHRGRASADRLASSAMHLSSQTISLFAIMLPFYVCAQSESCPHTHTHTHARTHHSPTHSHMLECFDSHGGNAARWSISNLPPSNWRITPTRSFDALCCQCKWPLNVFWPASAGASTSASEEFTSVAFLHCENGCVMDEQLWL